MEKQKPLSLKGAMPFSLYGFPFYAGRNLERFIRKLYPKLRSSH